MNEKKIMELFKKNFGDVDKTPTLWQSIFGIGIFLLLIILLTWKGIKFVVNYCKGVKKK